MTQVPGHAEMLGGRTKWSTNISKPAQDHEGNGEKTQGEMIRQHDKGGTTFTGKDSLFDCFATYQTQYSYITKITSLFVKMETRKGIYWVEGVTV